MGMQKFRVCVERAHEPEFYLFVDASTCGEAIRKVMDMVSTAGAKLVVEPAGSDRARELALAASRLLVDEYGRRAARGITAPLGRIDEAHALAKQAIAALHGSAV